MSFFSLSMVALIQGLTEFLPISSSGHIILIQSLFGMSFNINYDIALHLGTAGGVCCYFYKDMGQLFQGAIHTLKGTPSPERTFFFQVVCATLPVVCCGFFLEKWVGSATATPQWFMIFGVSHLVCGALLWISENRHQNTPLPLISYTQSLVVGAFQSLAFFPGISRLGICFTVGRLMGLSRLDAQKFSLILMVPTSVAAATLKGFLCLQKGNGEASLLWIWGVFLSGVVGVAAIHFMVAWTKRFTWKIFGIYRMIFAALVFLWISPLMACY